MNKKPKKKHQYIATLHHTTRKQKTTNPENNVHIITCDWSAREKHNRTISNLAKSNPKLESAGKINRGKKSNYGEKKRLSPTDTKKESQKLQALKATRKTRVG